MVFLALLSPSLKVRRAARANPVPYWVCWSRLAAIAAQRPTKGISDGFFGFVKPLPQGPASGAICPIIEVLRA